MASRPPETLLRHPSVAASQHRSIPASQHAADGKLHPRAKCFWEAATRPCLAHAREMRAPLGLIQRPPHPPSKKVTSESSRMSADGTVAFSFEKRIFCVGSSLVTHTSQLSWAHTGSGARAHARTGRLDCAPKHMLLLHARCACVRRPCLCSATRCLAHVCVCVCVCAHALLVIQANTDETLVLSWKHTRTRHARTHAHTYSKCACMQQPHSCMLPSRTERHFSNKLATGAPSGCQGIHPSV